MRYMMKYTDSYDDSEIGYVVAVDHENWTPKGWTQLDGQFLKVFGRYNGLFEFLGGDSEYADKWDSPTFQVPNYSGKSEDEVLVSSNLDDGSGDIIQWLNRIGVCEELKVYP